MADPGNDSPNQALGVQRDPGDETLEPLALLDRRKMLASNRVERKSGGSAREPSLLAGLIFDDGGERMTPTHANKKGRRYRYYVTHSLIKRGRPKASDASTERHCRALHGGWKSSDYCGDTFIDAAAEGAVAHPWDGPQSRLHIPNSYTEIATLQ